MRLFYFKPIRRMIMPESMWTAKVRYPNGDIQDHFIFRPNLEQASLAACWIAYSETVLEASDGLEVLAQQRWGGLTEEQKHAIAVKNGCSIIEGEIDGINL